MAVELAELAAGLPVAASFAVAGGIGSVREGRRRSSLNEAMHELRRPLQVLSLAVPDRDGNPTVGSTLQLAAVALERLDREINGGIVDERLQSLSPWLLLEEAARRWGPQAGLRGRALRLVWDAGEATILGRAFELAQAVDNLISNAIEHGSGEVTIEARREAPGISIAVRDAGAQVAEPQPPSRRRPQRRGRRGHGLRVAARVAREHGGDFELRRSERGTVAVLRLPLGLAGLSSVEGRR
jgi:signal transduction histidine kinase